MVIFMQNQFKNKCYFGATQKIVTVILVTFSKYLYYFELIIAWRNLFEIRNFFQNHYRYKLFLIKKLEN